MTLAALEATLALYHDSEVARREIPTLAMLTARPDELRDRAVRLAALCPAWAAAVVIEGQSAVGGGSFPAATLPTHLVALTPPAFGADALALRLRLGRPPVVARVAESRVLLDPRTLGDADLPVVGAVLADLDIA
jgi:L-seryl-tRNA(Ser) seleniumtransferase